MSITIGIVGLGLIGGSLAKALAKNRIRVHGWDISEDTLSKALSDGTITARLDNPGECDVLFIALYPSHAVEYITKNAVFLHQGQIITDLCGVKKSVFEKIAPICEQTGAVYIGAHPMAGKECWGYQFSDAEIFKGSSILLTPPAGTPDECVKTLTQLCKTVGFSQVIRTTPEEHDEIIAYTSQLAHIVSGAYMKSPTAPRHHGFSAGSYRDLTRVAKLNENMWTGLFLDNRENLSREIEIVINHLEEYKNALDAGDAVKLKALIRQARELKESIG